MKLDSRGVRCVRGGFDAPMSQRRSSSGVWLLGLAVVMIGMLMVPGAIRGAQVTSADGGFRMTVPNGWKREFRHHGIALYTGRVRHGALVPAGGAVILVFGFPPYDHPIFRPDRSDEANLVEFARDGRIISQTPATDGQRAQLTYVKLKPNYRSSMTVRHVGDRAFLMMVDCAADDPRARKYDTVGDRVISSITLISGPPVSTPAIRHHKVSRHRKAAPPTPAAIP